MKHPALDGKKFTCNSLFITCLPVVSCDCCTTLCIVLSCNEHVISLISGFRQKVSSLRMTRYRMDLLFCAKVQVCVCVCGKNTSFPSRFGDPFSL